VVPVPKELETRDDELSDPLNENRYEPVPGFIHKYRGRVLWLVTEACPVHCRFCFRRIRLSTEDDAMEQPSPRNTDRIIEAIAVRPDIHEVILSGGDPFMLPADILIRILDRLGEMNHIRLVRIHTRMPVVAPARVPDILHDYAPSSFQLRMVLHINHPREFTPECRRIAERWQSAKVPVLSQSVLLAEVNDDARVLHALFLDLASAGVQPYYMHCLDPAPGTSHFRVSEGCARRLIHHCREELPGYAVPRLVRDIPGRACKTLL